MEIRKYFITPVITILVGFLTALISSRFLGNWAFVILAIMYYICITYFVMRDQKFDLKKAYACPKLKVWTVLVAIFTGFLPLFVFITNIELLSHQYMILWLVFAIVNPFFEETFWRGYVIQGLETSPIVAVLLSTVLFTLSHPLMWGVFSYTLREPAMIASLLVMGSLWGVIYIKTKNLWLCVLSHMLVDLFNMNIFSFLDMIELGIG
ncbi:MAG: CPBP family intramembrane metalloprotease [Cellulosilyticum sp.]|nr:CPBP family intramembrane metalloprotease [Cellulosilyticum sp.]